MSLKENVESFFMRLPVLGGKLAVFSAAMMLLFGGVVSAAIVSQLSQAILSSGNVSAPFSVQLTAASVGTIANNSLSGADTVAGSAPETMTVQIDNNANQAINGYLEVSCTSPDSSLTKDYMSLDFDGVAPQYSCDQNGSAYFYRTASAEAFAGNSTQSPVVSYQFPITASGYYVGNYSCSSNVVVGKAC